ncbi:MAG TPA: SDR family oxidoreductase [Stenomitos sp.]
MGSILVTGATGNVGSEVLKRLVAAGAPVFAAVRQPSEEHRPYAEVTFDFERPDTFDLALGGVDRLFLMRPPALADADRTFAPLIRAAQAAKVRHIVFLSLLGAEKNGMLPHRKIEDLIVASGIPYTFLRPGFFMQNLSTTHRAEIRDRDTLFVPAGKGATSFIDARDIAEVAAKTLTEPGHEGQTYALTGAEALGYQEVARLLTEVLGRRITYANPSILRFVLTKRREGLPMPFVLVMAAIYGTCKLGLAGTLTPDVERLLGRPPRPMREFIQDHRAEWERSPAGLPR